MAKNRMQLTVFSFYCADILLFVSPELKLNIVTKDGNIFLHQVLFVKP